MDNKVTWLFAPGINAADPQITRYRDQITVNGEVLFAKHHIDAIGDQYRCVRFPEIDVEATQIPVFGFFIWAFMTFLMRLKGIYNASFAYAIWFNRYNLGQNDDVEAIHREYKLIPATQQVICYGVSRGSAATINWLAKYRPPNIKGIILEGCPSSLDHLAQYSTGLHHPYYGLVRRILPLFSNFKSGGATAYASLSDIPADIPILLITSRADKTVPSDCSRIMHEKLKAQGHRELDICVLDHARHDSYVSHNPEDTMRYQSAVYNFYARIGLF